MYLKLNLPKTKRKKAVLVIWNDLSFRNAHALFTKVSFKLCGIYHRFSSLKISFIVSESETHLNHFFTKIRIWNDSFVKDKMIEIVIGPGF